MITNASIASARGVEALDQRNAEWLNGTTLAVVPLILSVMASLSLLVAFGEKTALLPLALFFGWTQWGGRCGTAHFNTFGMLYRTADLRSWIRTTGVYTLSGLASSALVGAGLALAAMPLSAFAGLERGIVIGVAIVFAARELGALRFRLPQRDCQTNRTWVRDYGWTSAAAMWGFHIGLGFATVITYGGYYALLGLVVMFGEPLYGATLLGVYWLGRVLPFWAAVPVFYRSPIWPAWLRPFFHAPQAIALFCVAAILWMAA